MRVYFYGAIMLFRRFILRQNTGKVICSFAERMGVVYVKMAQILAMQNYGNIFTEVDRQALAAICDHCQPIAFKKIQRQLKAAYQQDLTTIFASIDPEPLGSASISQVHRAVLVNGQEVAIKIKRQDVTRRMHHDIRQIRRIIHRFRRLPCFRNVLGGDKALSLWADWIESETDFTREQQNLLRYCDFATSVNGKVAGTVRMTVPELYTEYCTENILVMELVKAPTINQLELNEQNKARLRRGLNDYLSLSFYALLHDLPVVFHGDPHGGNIYLDEAGNVGFLDLGLIFVLSPTEADFVRRLFLHSYNAQTDQLIELLLKDSDYTEFDRDEYRQTIENEIKQFRTIPVTQFFVEMIGIYTKYNIAPPAVLFKMAKAFVALFGINNFIENRVDTEELLVQQVLEYYLERASGDVKRLVQSGLSLLPNFLQSTVEYGPVHGLSQQVVALMKLGEHLQQIIQHGNEMLEFLRPRS